MTSVSVVIPTKNAGIEFRDVLNAIRNQTIKEVEIIVVDSGSEDETVPLAREFADEVLEIPPDDFHHGKTRNLGADKAQNDVIVFTVQDAIPASEGWLSKLTEPIASGQADITYGNQIAHENAKPLDKFFYKYFYPNMNKKITKNSIGSKPDFYLQNVFISDVSSAVSRRVWNNIQFDETVAMSEDKDFAFRATMEGYTLMYHANAKIHHSHDYSLASLFTRRYNDGMAFSSIANGDTNVFVTSGLEYIISEYKYLLKSGNVMWIPYALIYDAVYFISFLMGKHHEKIPSFVHGFVTN